MRHIRHIVVIVALGVAAFVGFAPSAYAASPAQVTLTFALTLSGTVPSNNIFLVTFPSNGGQFCGPCKGGHTYVLKLPWAKGTAVVPFRLDRMSLAGCVRFEPGSSSCPPQNQHEFAQFNVRPTTNQTFNAAFAYGTASLAQPSVPATGAAVDLLTAAGFIGFGTALFAIGSRRRRRSTTPTLS
jgi:hypothetical protein